MYRTVGVGEPTWTTSCSRLKSDIVVRCLQDDDCWSLLFFKEKGSSIAVSSSHHIEMLDNFLRTELKRRRVNAKEMWFQQDGATTRMARTSMEVIRKMFSGYVISWFSRVSWLTRFFDLSACDFFSWDSFRVNVKSHAQSKNKKLRQEI